VLVSKFSFEDAAFGNVIVEHILNEWLILDLFQNDLMIFLILAGIRINANIEAFNSIKWQIRFNSFLLIFLSPSCFHFSSAGIILELSFFDKACNMLALLTLKIIHLFLPFLLSFSFVFVSAQLNLNLPDSIKNSWDFFLHEVNLNLSLQFWLINLFIDLLVSVKF